MVLHDVLQITCCVHCVVDIALVFAHIKLRMWYCSLEVCFVILFTLVGIVLAGGTQLYIILVFGMVLRIYQKMNLIRHVM